MRARLRLLVAATCVAGALAAPGAARAGTLVTVPLADLVEDVSGPLESRFDVETGGYYELVWRYHPQGGACGSTPAGDDGVSIRTRTLEYLNPGANWWRIYTTFADAGRYVVCAWATRLDTGETFGSTTPISVREPRLALSVGVPGRVSSGAPFRLRAAAKAEAWRMVFVAINVAEVPCAASYITDRPVVTPIYAGWVRGTYADAAVVTLSRPGTYHVCAWVQEHARDPYPERRLERAIRVVRPRRGPTGRGEAIFDSQGSPRSPATGAASARAQGELRSEFASLP